MERGELRCGRAVLDRHHLCQQGHRCAQHLQTLDIALADVMAFGDNYNDVSMLDIVSVPYIMDGAAAPLREKYPNHTPRPEDVLREFLKQN
jgi:hydroxymethylpyrimidine pyrophosphatase-like HAD family hydrolase